MTAIENGEIWEQLAPWWDELTGEEGGELHRHGVHPTVTGLLGDLTGQRILEVGCGNGAFARHLATQGANVTATDQADAFIRIASTYPGPALDYRRVDATSFDELIALGPGSFDAAVANMVLMDMPEVAPLYRALAVLLRPGGRFVVTVLHPCFGYGVQPTPDADRARSARSRITARAWGWSEKLSDLVPWEMRRRLVERLAAISSGMASLRYLEPRPMRAQADADQPRPHWYFHRPLQDLLNPAFDAGLVLDRLVEPPYWNRETAQTGLLVCCLRRPALASTSPRPADHDELDSEPLADELRRLGDELRVLAETGLHYTEADPYNHDRYEQLRTLAARTFSLADVRGHEEIERTLFDRLTHLAPVPVADAAVVDDDDRILLIRRADDGLWAMPGGGYNMGETPVEGAVRETREETGYVVEPIDLVGVHDSRYCGSRSALQLYQFVFLCRVVSRQEITTPHEVTDVRWFAPSELPELSPGHGIRIAAVFQFLRDRRTFIDRPPRGGGSLTPPFDRLA
jgi:ADP-ribose pyrophosphatase YjhB (NUDIX family)/2-polyprenyl-3-methyl-5-hydroxy-6-metoxy-1,4-benzoquinol methylase